jgi:hypothetical protein
MRYTKEEIRRRADELADKFEHDFEPTLTIEDPTLIDVYMAALSGNDGQMSSAFQRGLVAGHRWTELIEIAGAAHPSRSTMEEPRQVEVRIEDGDLVVEQRLPLTVIVAGAGGTGTRLAEILQLLGGAIEVGGAHLYPWPQLDQSALAEIERTLLRDVGLMSPSRRSTDENIMVIGLRIGSTIGLAEFIEHRAGAAPADDKDRSLRPLRDPTSTVDD